MSETSSIGSGSAAGPSSNNGNGSDVIHPDVKYKIAAEDKRVLELNDAAKRLNDKAGHFLIKYVRNKYTGRMLLSSSS